MPQLSDFVLRSHHRLALEFLQNHPGDEIGVIETEGQLAAACIFYELMAHGYVSGTLAPGGGGCYLTPKAERAVIVGTLQ